jgi:hypothetical protein
MKHLLNNILTHLFWLAEFFKFVEPSGLTGHHFIMSDIRIVPQGPVV